jgi:hypothetical protein
VYDVTDRTSFASVRSWMQQIDLVCPANVVRKYMSL